MRRSSLTTHTHTLIWALACVTALGLAGPTHADVTQRVTLILDDEMGNRLDSDSDEVSVMTGEPITREIFASLPDVMGAEGYASVGSVGRFGQLGVQSELFRPGRLVNQVIIESDEHVNLTGRPQNAVANFIIDGGSASMIADVGSTLELQINIEALIFQDTTFLRREAWQGGFELEVMPGSGGNPEFRTFGEDILATFNGISDVDIPFSFQTFDIGAIPPSGRIELEYFLHVEADVVGFAEGVFWQFSDPLTVQMGGGQPLAPTVIIPEPASAAMVFALGALGVITRRGRQAV